MANDIEGLKKSNEILTAKEQGARVWSARYYLGSQ